MSNDDLTADQGRKSIEHDLKVWSGFYPALADGTKPFEVRKNDRDFRVGDTLLLREWNRIMEAYTGNLCRRRVTYLLNAPDFGIKPGFVVMGLDRPLNEPQDIQSPRVYTVCPDFLRPNSDQLDAGQYVLYSEWLKLRDLISKPSETGGTQ